MQEYKKVWMKRSKGERERERPEAKELYREVKKKKRTEEKTYLKKREQKRRNIEKEKIGVDEKPSK